MMLLSPPASWTHAHFQVGKEAKDQATLQKESFRYEREKP